jgi:hypothetical protein
MLLLAALASAQLVAAEPTSGSHALDLLLETAVRNTTTAEKPLAIAERVASLVTGLVTPLPSRPLRL